MRSGLKLLITVLGLADAMAVCFLDSYGLIGDVAIFTCIVTTVIGIPLFNYYVRRYHENGFRKKGF